MHSQPVYVRLERDLITRIDAVARRERRTRSAQIATWVAAGLRRDGLAEIDEPAGASADERQAA